MQRDLGRTDTLPEEVVAARAARLPKGSEPLRRRCFVIPGLAAQALPGAGWRALRRAQGAGGVSSRWTATLANTLAIVSTVAPSMQSKKRRRTLAR